MARKKTRGNPRRTQQETEPSASPPAAAPAASPDTPTSSRWRTPAVMAIVALLAAGAIAVAYRFDDVRARLSASNSTPPPAAPTLPAAQYIGRGECSQCHAKEHAAWLGSDHDLAMQVADEKSVLGNFANAKFSYAGTTTTFSRRDGKFIVNTDGPDGKLADYEIKYAFGVHPLQQYLIEFPGGRMQALSIAWDSRTRENGGQRWFHLYPGQNIKAGDFLHWTSPGQNWNFTCAECHSTNLRKNFDANSQTYKTTWSEINVSCEACHGPGSNHVAWAKATGDRQGYGAGKGLVIALDERRGAAWIPVAETGNAKRSSPRTTSRELDTCARCHGRASRLSDDYVHGKPPQDTHRLALIEGNLYWNDGQMRDEVYNWGSFAQSRMNAQGVTCSDCHDPHSLKLRVPGNAVCAQCHLPAKYDGTTHTHHAPGTAGAACASCHMPTTTYMGVDPRHDHSMRIPRPDVSARTGAPNACNNCHAKEKPQWAADAIAGWTGKAPASFQNFADAFDAAAKGAPDARGSLLALVEDKAQPAVVRASAIARLGPMLNPVIIDAITRALNDADPAVRLASVEALAGSDPAIRQRYLARMTDDPVRAVRIEAAHALAGAPERSLGEAQKASFAKAISEYVAVQTYNADRPEGRMSLGNLHAERGDAAAAIAEYRKAIEIDPTFIAAYANLADLYRSQGTEAEAESVLREGLARNPRAAALQHALGLSYARQKRQAESLRALRVAAELAPDNARYAYVHAVALNDAGKPGDALKVLNAALARHPHDRDLLSGLAWFTAETGNRAQALIYVKRLREIDPENAEYARMAETIGGGAPR